MAIRITCVIMDRQEHTNPYLGIKGFSWLEDGTVEKGTYSRLEMYLWLVNGGHAYVQNTHGHKTYLVATQTDQGIRYVRSTEDHIDTDDLLAVPLCSPETLPTKNKQIRTSIDKKEENSSSMGFSTSSFGYLSTVPSFF